MKKIYIFSYGLYPGQLTLETLAAMRECGAIYTHCLDAASARHFSKFAPGLKLTQGLGRREAALAAVAALKKHKTVGFLTYGNPLFLNQTAAEVMAASAKKKARVRVFAAVSSFDAIVNLFNLNNFSIRGLRVVDTATLMDDRAFTPDMDTLFFVPCALNRPANAAAKKRFIAAAAKAYPPSAQVYLADCASVACGEPRVTKGHMRDFSGLLSKLNERHTLFIPAVAPKIKKKPGAK
ncbi:MAG: hypothetical protein A2081_05410 [Elusimicrobia bacterium GWC2_61_19]|nr:MAG: hypothetical protein A2081_05410 [Elusimicrobia bacterium GWC2_61_19]